MTRVLRLGHNSTHGGSVLTLAGKDAVAAFFTPFGSAMGTEGSLLILPVRAS